MKAISFSHLAFAFTGGLLALPVSYARTVPDSLQAYYDKLKDGSCPIVLKGGLSKDDTHKGGFRYCSDNNATFMWIAGSSSLSDMDVDCDGANNSYGKCSNDPTGQSITAFQKEVSGFGIQDLDANLHSYVVLGTRNFDPQNVGVESLSIVAVVCNNQLFYGVWGDTNADYLVGEASISLATACFGSSMSGDYGHSQADVLYLAFRNHEAKPDSKVNWSAQSFGDFEESLAHIGDALIEKFLQGNSNNNGSPGNGANSSNGDNSSNRGSSGNKKSPAIGLTTQTPKLGLVVLVSLLIIPLMFYIV